MKFASRSVLILLALYGLVFAVADAYFARSHVPLFWGVMFAVIFVGLQFLLAPFLIQWLLPIYWEDVPQHTTECPQAACDFVRRVCAERGLRMPRIGVIQSGTPNAFSFGHTPRDGRIVMTTGLIDVLTPDELNAVLAHEIGHIEHWDMAVMAVASLVPLVLYQLYVFTRHSNSTRPVAFGAYVTYVVSQFIVLLLNRTREYFADHFSAHLTERPDLLASALVKIAYGMVRAKGATDEIGACGTAREKQRARRLDRLTGSMALLGISSAAGAQAMSLALAGGGDPRRVMRWDLANPWARIYELRSTHPLTAFRLRALARESSAVHSVSQYDVAAERLQWRTFPLQVAIWALPIICAVFVVAPEAIRFVLRIRVGIDVPPVLQPSLLIAAGALWMARVAYRYRGAFEPATVDALLDDVEVSEMRPRAVRLEGEIVGRGVPGAFWSSDLVLRDATGLMFLLYRQTIPFARFLFAITEAEACIGEHVVIEGWYRRGLRPYVEMSRLTTGANVIHRTYSRWIQLALAAAAVVIGWMWLNGVS